MLQRFIITVVAFTACLAVNAQGLCIINGDIADDVLYNGKKIKKVYLTRTDDYGRKTNVCSAKVKKGKYTLKYKVNENEPAMLYTITGLGEGRDIELFVEQDEIIVDTAKAAEPGMSDVNGSPLNNLFTEYKYIAKAGKKRIAEKVGLLKHEKGDAWLDSKEGKIAVAQIKGKEEVRVKSEQLRYLIDHNTSAFVPFEMQRTFLPIISDAYAEQMANSVSTTLHSHPYYKSFKNAVLARSLKVGNVAPDIALKLADGNTGQLSDYRGKFVLLNVWAADCEKSIEELEYLKALYSNTKDKQDNFVILSVSFDKDATVWKNAMESNGINMEGWLHSCELAGSESPAAKLLGVKATPQIMLFDPEGRAISLDMTGEEALERVEQILAGDLYYLDQKE